MSLPRVRVAWVLLLGLASTGGCPGGLRTIVIDAPPKGLLFDDPAPSVVASARLGSNFALAATEVRFEGVDLIDALGLVPPFADQSGVVSIGAASVSISDFRVTATTPRRVDLVATGFAQGPHVFEVAGIRNATVPVLRTVAFDLTGPMSLAAQAGDGASGLPFGPESAGSEGVLVGAILGEPFAAPPIDFPDGSNLRSGFVEVSEAVITGATP